MALYAPPRRFPSPFAAYPRTGRWSAPSLALSVDGAIIDLVDGRETASPLIVGYAGIIDRIGIKVATTAGSVGSVIRLGIRADDGSGYPGATVLLDAGTVDSTSIADLAITVSHALPPGLYWLTCTSQGAAGTQPKVHSASIGSNRSAVIGATTQADASNPSWSNATPPVQTSISGALPSSWTGTSRASYWPLITVRWA
jgi:hypothetical protein